MKRIVLIVLLFLFFPGSVYFPVFGKNLSEEDKMPAARPMTEQQILDILSFGKIRAKGEETYEVWKTWGLEIQDPLTAKVLKREFNVLPFPEKSSERVYRTVLFSYKTGPADHYSFQDCYLNLKDCFVSSEGYAFVAPPDESEVKQTVPDFSDFFILANNIEESRLIFLVDFYRLLISLESNQAINLEGVVFNKWTKDVVEFVDTIQSRGGKAKISKIYVGTLDSSRRNYILQICYAWDEKGYCKPESDYETLMEISFPSYNVVELNFGKMFY